VDNKADEHSGLNVYCIVMNCNAYDTLARPTVSESADSVN